MNGVEEEREEEEEEEELGIEEKKEMRSWLTSIWHGQTELYSLAESYIWWSEVLHGALLCRKCSLCLQERTIYCLKFINSNIH
jgi:hypothetical protein